MPKTKKKPLPRAQQLYDAYCAVLEATNLVSQSDTAQLEFILARVVTEFQNRNLSKAQDIFKRCITNYCDSKTNLLTKMNHSSRSLEIIISYLEQDIQILLNALTTDCVPNIRLLFNELIPLAQITEKIDLLASSNVSLSLAFKDKCKHQLATLYSVFATCQFLQTKYALSRAFHELTFKMIVACSPSFQKDLPSQSLAKLSINTMIFIELAEGHTTWALEQLNNIFKSQLYFNDSEAFYRNCLAASARYAEMDDYANAYRWLTRALPFHTEANYEFWTMHFYFRRFNSTQLKVGENQLEKLRAWYLVLHIQAVEGLLHYKKRGFSLDLTPDSQTLTLQTTIKRWTPIPQANLLRDLDLRVKFAYSKIIITPVIETDLSSLTKLIVKLNSLEQAHEKKILRKREQRELRKIQFEFEAMTLTDTTAPPARTFLPSYASVPPQHQPLAADDSMMFPDRRLSRQGF